MILNKKISKKTLLIIVTAFIFVFVSIILLINVRANGERKPLVWDSNIEEVYAPENGGVWYPRMIELDNGDWLLSFDTNEDGEDVKAKLVRSSDQGQTWSGPITVIEEQGHDIANAQMLQLDNGDLWMAYRSVSQNEGMYHTELNVQVSNDNGENWNALSNGLIDTDEAYTFNGVWEPHLGYIGDQVAVMYAHDGPSEVGTTGYQNILMKIWENDEWSEQIVVSDGVSHFSRDGMPVWLQMDTGEYIVVYEASNRRDHPFIIKYETSADGLEWSDSRNTLYVPEGEGKKAGAPYIEMLENGTLIAGLQTDEDSVNTGDPYTSMKTLTSLDNGISWNYQHHTFPVPYDFESNWNSMMSSHANQLIAVTSSSYPRTGIYIRRGYRNATQGENLVNNWSFETGNLNGWSYFGNDYPERILLHETHNELDTPENSGDYYIGFTWNGEETNTAYIGQTIYGLKDDNYTLSAFIKSSGGQTESHMEVIDYGGEGITLPIPVSDDWLEIKIENIEVRNGEATIGFFSEMIEENQWLDIDMVEFYRE